MKNELISVIVPIYNVEKYLEKCIDSIMSQTYRNLEIILVDDGSPDRCPLICDQYAQKDKRIQVIHKKNGGLSEARNVGIQSARGTYIGFVDSDDYIEPDMYEYLYELCKKENADIATCGYRLVSAAAKDEPIAKRKGEIKTIAKEDALHTLFEYKQLDNFAWNKLYSKTLFDTISFPVGKLYEDLFTMYQLLDKANKVCVSSTVKYNYLIRPDSIMGRRNFVKREKFEAYYEIIGYVRFKYPELEPYIIQQCYISLVSDVFKVIAADEISENDEFFLELRNFTKTYNRALAMKKAGKEKLFFFIALHAPGLLRLRHKILHGGKK